VDNQGTFRYIKLKFNEAGTTSPRRNMFSKKSIFVFIDESGNFDFSETGTRHLVLSAAICYRPIRSSTKMLDLKYSRYASGYNTPGFHASQDRPNTRNEVFKVISAIKSIEVFTTIIRKREFAQSGLTPQDIYHSFGIELAEQLHGKTSGRQVVFIFDKAFKAKEEAALFGTLKTRLATFETQYLIYFQNVSKDLNAQIADYVAWANFVCFERENAYWKNLLPERLSTHHFLEVHP